MRGIEQIPFFYDLMMAVAEATGFEIEAEGRRSRRNVRLFTARPR
jgi:hypothetical protein